MLIIQYQVNQLQLRDTQLIRADNTYKTMFSFKNIENTLLIDNDQKDMATKHEQFTSVNINKQGRKTNRSSCSRCVRQGFFTTIAPAFFCSPLGLLWLRSIVFPQRTQHTHKDTHSKHSNKRLPGPGIRAQKLAKAANLSGPHSLTD